MARGYEIQIDDRGIDHDSGAEESPLHRTGAIYARTPATVRASKAPGAWNTFAIEARDTTIAVTLNGTRVSRLDDAQGPRRGYVGLQAHDERYAARSLRASGRRTTGRVSRPRWRRHRSARRTARSS